MAKNSSNILVEGKSYNFKVLKIITLYDGNDYFVIEAINNNKYLLNCSLYKNYDININDIIECRVDKINCSGRTFLEPKHPYLFEEKVFEFEILRIEELLGDDKKEQSLIIQDNKNKQYNAVLDYIVNPKELSKFIKARIKKISKARIYLDIID